MEGETEEADTLRPRRVYRPTQAGLDALRAWASQGLTVDDMVKRSDEMMLRFAFLGQVADT